LTASSRSTAGSTGRRTVDKRFAASYAEGFERFRLIRQVSFVDAQNKVLFKQTGAELAAAVVLGLMPSADADCQRSTPEVLRVLVLFKQTQVRISAGEEPVDESTRRWCYRRRANAAEASGGTLSLKSEKIVGD